MTLTIDHPAAPAVEPAPAPKPAVQTLRSPDEVRAWLRSLPPDAVCGYSASASKCPLATYLNTINEREGHVGLRASVGTSRYDLDGAADDYRCEMPRWAQSFICGVDALARRCGQPLNKRITAQQALEVLEGALRVETGL